MSSKEDATSVEGVVAGEDEAAQCAASDMKRLASDVGLRSSSPLESGSCILRFLRDDTGEAEPRSRVAPLLLVREGGGLSVLASGLSWAMVAHASWTASARHWARVVHSQPSRAESGISARPLKARAADDSLQVPLGDGYRSLQNKASRNPRGLARVVKEREDAASRRSRPPGAAHGHPLRPSFSL
ncbi:hypothetical protein HPB48_005961 [Haemaphysalis longicornis]|uniref:Uncharacterized protein n=1 Tax=Haemaphysalis longicornis TaxID=44386 RepID=A0A9J6FK90_HAELO|nr:hypothetical protein HPB48_005961 [Haemaphysalis longicornis]